MQPLYSGYFWNQFFFARLEPENLINENFFANSQNSEWLTALGFQNSEANPKFLASGPPWPQAKLFFYFLFFAVLQISANWVWLKPGVTPPPTLWVRVWHSRPFNPKEDAFAKARSVMSMLGFWRQKPTSISVNPTRKAWSRDPSICCLFLVAENCFVSPRATHLILIDRAKLLILSKKPRKATKIWTSGLGRQKSCVWRDSWLDSQLTGKQQPKRTFGKVATIFATTCQEQFKSIREFRGWKRRSMSCEAVSPPFFPFILALGFIFSIPILVWRGFTRYFYIKNLQCLKISLQFKPCRAWVWSLGKKVNVMWGCFSLFLASRFIFGTPTHDLAWRDGAHGFALLTRKPQNTNHFHLT